MAFLTPPCPLPTQRACQRSTRTSPSMKAKKRRGKPGGNGNDAAPRIDVSTSTLSLRQQLNLAKAATADNTPTRPVVRTKFRKKKAVAPLNAHITDTDIPDGKYAKAPDPMLYIDGYNVIGSWPRLRKFRDRGDMEHARTLLLSDVSEFSHVRGWDCEIVFDAQRTDELEKRDLSAGVNVVFTGAETADTYIERCVYQKCEEGIRQVWAATSDIAQLSFSRAKGAHIMSSKLFVQELKRAKKETREKVAEHDASAVRGKMLISNVDQTTRDRLYRLRDGKPLSNL